MRQGTMTGLVCATVGGLRVFLDGSISAFDPLREAREYGATGNLGRNIELNLHKKSRIIPGFIDKHTRVGHVSLKQLQHRSDGHEYMP